jgi:hypothetical protein
VVANWDHSIRCSVLLAKRAVATFSNNGPTLPGRGMLDQSAAPWGIPETLWLRAKARIAGIFGDQTSAVALAAQISSAVRPPVRAQGN